MTGADDKVNSATRLMSPARIVFRRWSSSERKFGTQYLYSRTSPLTKASKL